MSRISSQFDDSSPFGGRETQANVGAVVGWVDGFADGCSVGGFEGWLVGLCVDSAVGCTVGCLVGCTIGCSVGGLEGWRVGAALCLVSPAPFWVDVWLACFPPDKTVAEADAAVGAGPL